MYYINQEELHKIQAILDLFSTEEFLFKINEKTLETLIFGGGMGVDTSTEKLATALAKTGSAGTIALTKTRHDYAGLDLRDKNHIIGVNNLVGCTDYEPNYELGRKIGADFIASGAGISRDVLKRIKKQTDYFSDDYHYYTVPLISSVSQLHGHIKRNSGFIILENEEAGGHNGKGKTIEQTIEDYKSANIDKKGNKIIFAGGIRTPYDAVKVLDAGFEALQIASMFLLAEEANVDEYYRNLILNAKSGDVANIPSPAGLPAKGFVNAGIMPKVLKGESLKKLPCENTKEGCFPNCQRIALSAEAGEIKVYGDYCIEAALYALHPEDGHCLYSESGKEGTLYFCGARPEDIFIRDYMNEHALNSLPLKSILGKFMAGMFDSVMNGDGLQIHRGYLERKFISYQADKPKEFSSKLAKELVK